MSIPGPDTHVVELRVPGLVGTSGESLLDSIGTVEVAGDGIGRLIRPSDRLRRPAPGPVLQALGRSVSRTLEGYLWDRMTSGNIAKATWALLFPFSLANVTHWMLPPVPQGRKVPAVLAAGCQGLLRVAALLLTMLLVTQLAVVSLELVAVQCLTPGSPCLSYVPAWLRETTGPRMVIGILPPLLVIGLLFRVSSTNWTVTTAEREGEASEDILPGGQVVDGADTPMLRCVHTVAALSCIALLLLGGPLHAPAHPVDALVWMMTLILLGFAVGSAAVRARRLLGPVLRAMLITGAIGVVVTAAVLRAPLPAAQVGTNDTLMALGTALLATGALFAMLLVPAALLARPTWTTLPYRLRPWAGGWAAAPALALAGLLGSGFGAGLAIAARRLIGAPGLQLPPGYTLITSLWGVVLVAALLAALGFAVAIPLRQLRRGEPEVVRIMQNEQRSVAQAARAWVRASVLRKHLHRVVLAIVLITTAEAAALLALLIGTGAVPAWLGPLSGLGVAALGALAAALLRTVYSAATSPQSERHLGAFMDLVCFWPRAAHPVIPPSYALKVVPELIERTREHLGKPGNRVVLAGYHIGGLLAVMTTARLVAHLPGHDRQRVGLLTAGAPLQWGYQRAFPAVFPHASLARLYGQLDGRWRGLCRGTDTFGGGATTWRHQVAEGELLGIGYRPDGDVGFLESAIQGPNGVLVLGGDHWLPDPMREPDNGRRWIAGVRRHTDYVADPEWDRAIVMAAGLEEPKTTAQPAEYLFWA